MVTETLTRTKIEEMPDIFHAAQVNDVDELMQALDQGQRLDTRNPRLLNMTPLHVACIRSSNAFVEAAVRQESCDPWLRDDNIRVAFDHAAARGNKTAMELTLDAMYPRGWDVPGSTDPTPK